MSKHVYQDHNAVQLYQETHYFPDNVKEEIGKIILTQLNLRKNPKILYAGSGDGSCFLFPILKSFFNQSNETQTFITIVCVDNSESMREKLIENLKQEGFKCVSDKTFKKQCSSKIAQVKLLEADIEDPSTPLENDFDMLLCPFLLHHLINWRLILARLLCCLKCDGIVVLAERLGDVAYMDGNFSKEDPSNTLKERFLKFNASRNKVSMWLPEIKASDYSSVVEALISGGAEIKEFSWKWKYTANLQKWVENKVYTNFWLGLKDEDIKKITSDMNIPQTEIQFYDGLRIIVARIGNPYSLSERILSFFPRAVLSKLWQPVLYTSEALEYVYLELLRELHLCATHGVFTGMTQWAFAVYWSPATQQWHPQMPLMFFDYKPMEREVIHSRIIQLLRYFHAIRQLEIAFIDLIFLYLRQKPIIIIRRKQDSSEVEIKYDWDSSIDLRGFRRCLHVFIDLPVWTQQINRGNFQIPDADKFIHQLRSNWYVIKWKEIMDEYLNKVPPYSYQHNDDIKIELSEEIVGSENGQRIQEILGKISKILSQLMADSDLTHIVYVPSEFFYTDVKRPSFGYGGIIFGEKLITLEKDFIMDQMEENLLQRAKWCKLIVDRIHGQIGQLDYRLTSYLHALRSAVAAVMARNMSHNIDSHITPRATVEAVRKRLKELGFQEDFQKDL
ncbi:MAG: class I SAM-dependent methyltransferase, partial [candidate division WOR-3 bacterium]